MSKKIFTLLLLAVFVLAQFSIASAAEVTSTSTLAGPSFSDGATIDFDWTVADLSGATDQSVDIYARVKGGTYALAECQAVTVLLAGTTSGIGSVTYTFTGVPADQATWEFLIEVDGAASCTTLPANAALASNKSASAFIDKHTPNAFEAVPPSKTAAAQPNTLAVSCNTFEFWGMASDTIGLADTDGYSGVKSWKQVQTGTFAAPAPEGTAPTLLSWPVTIPATASGIFVYSVTPTDVAGNAAAAYKFRDIAGTPGNPELADCKDFSDTAGNANELYVRYMADLGIGAGNPDGTYGPDTTLTRAEAAVMYELANGVKSTDVTFPDAPPSAACTFTDVTSADWFAGWVWQACDDGFVAGTGAGMFDPAATFTRGQAVTILNNIHGTPGAVFFATNAATYQTVLNTNALWEAADPYRTAAFTDVSVGAFYAQAVVRAYQTGVIEGSSASTFGPDDAITRGDFAKLLYRSLSRVP